MHYPAILNIKEKHVVVVGGGKIATRKVTSLVEAKAIVTVISPQITNELYLFFKEQKIQWKQKTFEPIDVKEAFLIIAATDDREVNEKVYQSKKEYQLINMVDQPEKSDFIVPSVLKRGKLIISISTSGAFPGLAKNIKQDLCDQFDTRYESYLSFLEECRIYIINTIKNEQEKRVLLKELLNPALLDLSEEERERMFQQLIEQRREMK